MSDSPKIDTFYGCYNIEAEIPLEGLTHYELSFIFGELRKSNYKGHLEPADHIECRNCHTCYHTSRPYTYDRHHLMTIWQIGDRFFVDLGTPFNMDRCPICHPEVYNEG